LTGVFLWPSTTPGSVSTSTSRSAARCASAKRRICVCANSMSALTPAGSSRMQASISAALSRNEAGLQRSNCCEYSRTAASPRAATSAMMPSTVRRTSACCSAFSAGGWPVFR